MSESMFFMHYAQDGVDKHSMIDAYREAFASIYDRIPELPFSNIWVASHLSERLPSNSLFHISASNTRRAWNMFLVSSEVESTSNVGCCGIDGSTSALIGASLARPNKISYLFTGDLAFFYDLNSLGNRHVGSNVRILLINNGIGAEFKLSVHKCYAFGDEANKYMAAGGHFGNKSPHLIKHYAEDLGFEYLTASSKEEFLLNIDRFTNAEITDKPMLFEVFTNHEDERDALDLMSHIDVDVKRALKSKLVGAVRSVVGESGVNTIKNILKR
jgi:2-succinyl-5-enolpyruvyl-6-hydroxy-3-cyclohexene-1-carboxylate synthase